MNFKRVLTMLLALCLIVNMAVPGVSALTAGENEYVPGQNPTASEKTTQGERINITTLKNAVQAEPAAAAEGEWTAERVDVESDLLKAELPQGVKELREAAELYKADEVVPVFIVLEDEPPGRDRRGHPGRSRPPGEGHAGSAEQADRHHLQEGAEG